MKIIKNSGADRVVDELRSCLKAQSCLDVVTPQLSLFAYAELKDMLSKLDGCRLILPKLDSESLSLQGSEADREFRNSLLSRYLAKDCSRWLEKKVDIRKAPGSVPQAALIVSDKVVTQKALIGSCGFRLGDSEAATRCKVLWVPLGLTGSSIQAFGTA